MGSNASKHDDTDIDARIDLIASQYIQGMGNLDMIKLLDATQCNKMVILTADAIKTMLENAELAAPNGKLTEFFVVPKNEFNNSVNEPLESVSPSPYDFFQQRTRNHMNTNRAKKLNCTAVAKRYVKIFHLFAAIRFAILGITTDKFEPISTDLVGKADYGTDKVSNGAKSEMQNVKLRNSCRARLGKLVKENTNGHPTILDYTDKDLDLDDKPFEHLDTFIKVLYKGTYDNNGTFRDPLPKDLQTDAESLAETYGIKTDDIKKFGDIPRKHSTVDTDQDNSLNLKGIHAKIKNADEKHNKYATTLFGILNKVFEQSSSTDKTNGSRISTFNIRKTATDAVIDGLMRDAKTAILDMEGNCEKDYIEIVKMIERLRAIEFEKSQIVQDVSDERNNKLEATVEEMPPEMQMATTQPIERSIPPDDK